MTLPPDDLSPRAMHAAGKMASAVIEIKFL